MVQQVVLGVFELIFEVDFSPHSHGFRPGRNTFSALRELYGHVRTGHIYLVDVDIAKFFDTIPHEPLIDAVAERVADGSVLRLIRLFLEALIQDRYRLVRPRAGTPQGGVISPLLANIYLARLDRTLEVEGVRYVRYADDVRLASRTPAGARASRTRTGEVLEGLGLRLNPQKTKLVSIYQGVDFLGYRLIRQKGHLNVYLSPAVVERCRAQVRQLTRRTAGRACPCWWLGSMSICGAGENTSSGHSVAGCWHGWTSGWRVGCEPTERSTGAIPSGADIRTSTCTAHLG